MQFSTEKVASFTDFQGELEQWQLLAAQVLGKPVNPCCTYYGKRDIDIWQAIKATPPIASLGKAFMATRRCTKCNAPSLLRVVTPSEKPGFGERLYQCTACGHSETLLISVERPRLRLLR